MPQQLTKIYDLAYFIDRDLNVVHLEQSNSNSEQVNVIKLNGMHINLLAEQMHLMESNDTARMGKVVCTELDELLKAISEHWVDISEADYVDLSHLTQIKVIYEKTETLSRIAGCHIEDYGDAVGSDRSTIQKGVVGHANAQASLLEI